MPASTMSCDTPTRVWICNHSGYALQTIASAQLSNDKAHKITGLGNDVTSRKADRRWGERKWWDTGLTVSVSKCLTVYYILRKKVDPRHCPGQNFHSAASQEY